jgi:hypothetical protein
MFGSPLLLFYRSLMILLMAYADCIFDSRMRHCPASALAKTD